MLSTSLFWETASLLSGIVNNDEVLSNPFATLEVREEREDNNAVLDDC